MEVIDICNLALGHLGMLPITSLSGLDPSSKACNRYFNISRDETLENYPWPFALVQDSLSLNGGITFTRIQLQRLRCGTFTMRLPLTTNTLKSFR